MKMRRWFVVAICLAVFGLLGGTSFAAEKIMDIRVPFDFTVDGNVVPGGGYSIVVDGPSRNSVLLQSDVTGDVTSLPVLTRLADTGRNKAYLVFDKTSKAHYLSEIHIPGKDGYAILGAPGEHEHMMLSEGDK